MKVKIYLFAVAMIIGVGLTYFAVDAMAGRGNNDDLGEVFVTSQGLYYDTFVPVETLPYRGRFQKLENGKTEFGPGDPGYLGGRWWVDLNGNGEMDPPGDGGDKYLLCPLLPPGREESNSE